MLDVAIFLSWKFLMACVAVSAAVETLKRVMMAQAPRFVAAAGGQTVLALANLVAGPLAAFALGLPDVGTVGQRIVVGIAAGFVSHGVYTAVFKRILGVIEERKASGQAPAPAPQGDGP